METQLACNVQKVPGKIMKLSKFFLLKLFGKYFPTKYRDILDTRFLYSTKVIPIDSFGNPRRADW